ncbi:hypothetical protein KVG88_09160 [Pseudomonas sp. SWRI74]|uniref:Uncharacterized protein n=1 Tax=Pseudomonas azerbaijanoccidentalis TaxID=2842347 RepID=A0ABS6QMR6_9PSED|nr:hypothetical protein [Pseudomonas azerbaijanoccidentalis]MBV4520230.1 hypothetical protein [Pseudomonas azerbaijanoccidentalis]
MNDVHIGLIFLIILSPLLLLMVWLIYVVQVHTEKAEAFLCNSHFVSVNKAAFSNMGVFGKFMRSGVLTMVLIMPGISVRRGIVNAAEVERFPKALKRMLVISWGGFWLLSIAFIVFGVFVKCVK